MYYRFLTNQVARWWTLLELAAACAGVPLRVPWLPDPQNTGPTSRARLAVLAEFRRRFPEVELEAFSGISIPGMASESRLMLAIAGGMAPDVLSVNIRMSDTYIQSGFLWPLDELVAQSYPDGRDGFLARAPKALWPVLEREGPSVAHFPAGRHLWYRNGPAMTRVLAWRKDLFLNAGLDPNRPPQDWEEFYSYARRLTSPADHVYGMNIHTGNLGAWDFMAFMAAAGGSAVEQDSEGRWYAAFGTRECAEALDFFIRLTTEPWRDGEGKLQRGYTTLSSTTEGAGEMMAETAMEFRYLDEETMGGWLDPATIGIAPIPPRMKGGSARPEINSHMAGIFSGIQDRRNRAGELVPAAEIRRMAWEYIRFMESDDAHQITADVLVASGSGAAMSPQWMRKFGYPEYLRRFPLEFEQVYNQSLEQGVPEPYGRNCQMIYYALGEPVDAAQQLARKNQLPVEYEERISLLQKMMLETAERTTVRMLENLSPEEQERRNHVAVIVAIVILALLCLALWMVWSFMAPKGDCALASRSSRAHRSWLAWAIMFPALISILLWVYLPMASGSRILFLDYHFVGESHWVGLRNLASVLYDAAWWKAVFNTLRYMALILGLGFFTPIVLAIMLQEVSCGKLLYRTLFYLP
ncbi:MAG: extracellular solute-binding protein, partial [Victivallales bacterium]|nr:extracellular solute-binding protein [Victivallales bacterium]